VRCHRPILIADGRDHRRLRPGQDRGIFGFHLTFSSGLAWTVLIVEGAGVVMLLLTAALLGQRQ
jgi:hypothetical protein